VTPLIKRRVEVFLAMSPVFRKGHTTRNPLPERWGATWVTRRHTTDLYTSKTCDTREEAIRRFSRSAAASTRVDEGAGAAA
jgi:hypothetical protein